VTSVAMFSNFGLTPLAYVGFGALVDVIGLGWTATGCGVLLLAAIGYALADPEVRHATLPSDEPDDAAPVGDSEPSDR
jgi:hypothetical protein